MSTSFWESEGRIIFCLIENVSDELLLHTLSSFMTCFVSAGQLSGWRLIRLRTQNFFSMLYIHHRIEVVISCLFKAVIIMINIKELPWIAQFLFNSLYFCSFSNITFQHKCLSPIKLSFFLLLCQSWFFVKSLLLILHCINQIFVCHLSWLVRLQIFHELDCVERLFMECSPFRPCSHKWILIADFKSHDFLFLNQRLFIFLCQLK